MANVLNEEKKQQVLALDRWSLRSYLISFEVIIVGRFCSDHRGCQVKGFADAECLPLLPLALWALAAAQVRNGEVLMAKFLGSLFRIAHIAPQQVE